MTEIKQKKLNEPELSPICEKKESSLDIKDLQEISQNISNTMFIDNATTGSGDSFETFIKTIVENLFSEENISLKTEYKQEDEQFCSSKLDFLINKGGFGIGKNWLHQWKVPF